MLDEETIIYSAGISYKIHNIRTGEVKLFFSINGGGIGAVAVHPQQKYFAVAEKGSYPNIYIYEFPSLKLYRIMRYGTERSYSNISFSLNGDKLASVGSQPDYNICIWDWRNEILVLKAKAFSQEVFRVVFSTFSDTILSTSGLAHLRFWKIANTFTGLKLKGQTGKFGSVELSDITGFTIFPDGKVLSGSENGKLLLWEGNLIKAVLSITPEKNCHEGVINTVVRVGEDIVSAGNDGKIKFWEFRPIDEMEPNEQLEGFVEPIKEFQLVTNPQDPPEKQRPAQVMEIIVYKDYWLVHDGLGKVFKVRVSESGVNQQEILNFNSGKIKGLASSKEGNAVATIGEDGGIRLLDFVNRKEYYSRVFKGKGSCIEWLNVAFNSTDKYVAAGFKNGIVRIAYFSKDKVYLQQAMKVHNNPVTAIKLSPNGELMAVLSQEGELFFLSVKSAASRGGLVFKPICIHPMNKKVNYIMWGKHSERLLLATATGEVIELDVRDVTSFDSSETYLNDSIPSRSYSICMMEFQKPKIDENDIKFLMEDNVEHQEVEWDPASISAVHYINEEEGEFICAAEAEYAGYYYICRFDQKRPIKAIQTTKNTTKFFSIPRDSETLISGTENGEVYIRPLNNMETFSLLRNHDQNSGLIVGALYNPSMTALITAAEDATVLTKAIDLNYLKEVGVMRQRQAYEREQKKKKQGKGVEEQAVDDAVAEEGEEEEYWSDEDDEDRKFKPDAYDIAISEMPINTPDLVDGLDEHFFVEDIADRKDAKDIIDDSIYSIQEEKLLAEEDKRKREAEQVKEEMRQNITKLRESFEIIKKSNSELDSFLKLEFKDFNIDDEYYKMLQSRVTDMLDEANKEVSWTIEYHKMKSKKLKDFYLSELDFNRFSVKSFKKPFAVTTMKIKQPNLMTRSQWGEMEPSKLMEEKKEEHNNTAIDEKGRDIISTDKNMIELWIQDKTDNGINKDINFLKEKKKRLRDNQGESSKEKFTRQKMKADKDVRSKMKQELLATKPSAKTANENEEIKKAEASMGNYVLKSDPNYEVPNTERMSMKKQQRMIYLYEEFIYGSKKDFNTSLQNMREWKERLFAKIISSNERIKEINKEIGEEEVLWNPEYDEYIEFPERILEVSPEEVHDLAKEKEEERLRKKMGRFGGAEAAIEKEIANSDGQGEDQPENRDVWKELEIKDRKNVKTQISKLEAEMNQIKQLKLKTEKKLLIEEMESEVKDYDEKLDDLSQKKIRLESEMKFIQMKLLTSYQELIILEAFEAKDMYLLKEYEEQKAKDKDNTENINKNTLQITEKKESMKTLELKQKEADDKFYEKLQNTVSKPVANAAYEFFKATDKKSKPTDDGIEDVDNQLDDDDEDVFIFNLADQ